MKRIFINFLDLEENHFLNFSGIDSALAVYPPENVFQTSKAQNVLDFIQDINTNEEPLLISFFAHGGRMGIASKLVYVAEEKLLYTDLVTALNHSKTNYPLILNLTAICHSYCIEQFVTPGGNNQIWCTTDETMSIHNSIRASSHGDFERFKMELPNELYDLYFKLLYQL